MDGNIIVQYNRCETRLGRLSNELQQATFEDPDISFESTNLFKDLHAKFETYKQSVRSKIQCYLSTGSKISNYVVNFANSSSLRNIKNLLT